MAHDLQQHFARLKTQSPRGAPEPSQLSEGLANSATQREHALPPRPPVQPSAASSTAAKPLRIGLTGRAPRTASGGTADLTEVIIPETPHEEEAALAASLQLDRSEAEPTAAMEIPHQRGRAADGSYERAFDGSMDEPSYFDSSTVASYVSKRSSISFHPEVKLDNGDLHALAEPLPPMEAKSRPRGRSMLEELQVRDMQRQLSRARSETDREAYDLETGEPLDSHEQGRRDLRYVEHQPRWPFLQSTVDDLAHQSGARSVRVPLASLTTDATVSPAVEELQTPDSIPAAHQLSPIAIASPAPVGHGDWFATASTEPPRRLASRSKSYSTERRSLRQRSRRSTSNTATSPAATFLDRFKSGSPSPAVAPDGEGQEVDEYVLGREIGFGGFSTIREASTIENGERVFRAVKIVRRRLDGKTELENEALQAEYEREVEIWRSLSHEHILPLHAVYVTDYATFAITHLNTGGTLYDAVLKARSGLEPYLCRRYAYQAASAIRYLHEDMHIVHRDIKLENCLIDIADPATRSQGGRILVCDFGLADYMVEDDRGSDRAASPTNHRNGSHDHAIGPSDTSTNFTGSVPYASPEMIDSGRPILSAQSDVWAFGVVAFAIITGRLPFHDGFTPRVFMMILNGEYDKKMLKAREAGISTPATNGPGREPNGHAEAEPVHAPTIPPPELAGATELVKGCLNRDSKSRWDIRDCLSSRWLEPEMEASGERPGWAA